MQQLTNKYKKLASSINKRRQQYVKNQTIIFNLSESFADPRRIPNVFLVVILFRLLII